MKQKTFDFEISRKTPPGLERFATAGITIAGTGHRPDALGGYSEEARDRLIGFARQLLLAYREVAPLNLTISGMALGWDQALAEASLSLSVAVLAAVPCDGQDSTWPPHAQKRYADLLAHPGVKTVVVSPGAYEPRKMQVRNEWMVDRAEVVLALWNGKPGGTANCVSYAYKKIREKRPDAARVHNVWAEWEKWCER
jgi:uncharacterized phage-like protein YoqJ